MSDGAQLYSVDTSSFMDWQDRFYPSTIFPTLATRLAELIEAGRLTAPSLVHDELKAVGSADLASWAATNASIFVATDEVLADALAIQGQFAGLRDPKAEFEEADAYVIALARLRGGAVVTQETEAAQKRSPKRTHFIPDVCRELGIPCFSLLGLIRREGWQF